MMHGQKNIKLRVFMSVVVGCTSLTIQLPDSHKKHDKLSDSTYSQVKIQVLMI